ncbi:NYN domain-containing protein [Rhodococcus sp. AG1013]|uniref:NYN domain-containing protein n=1 Tax=Rhodococcus sp. AG1013 TaxID=2183996 RepID=UPI000E0C53C9|nr:NYN domain-containing protein [Rhodococcus sp. AG1013]RDI11291.1 NYN domain-containing protein [Rhodococcus sp. AG1013]
MRSTCSLYIDAGYLLAAAATRVTGTSLRSGIYVDYATLISSLVDTAEARSGLPVLRLHWYDSARNGVPDARQERIGELSKVKLRLGRFGVNGDQKGVDLRLGLGLGLVAHARNRASEVFFLVSGDDLTEAVEEAQVHGVQVVLLAVPTVDGKPHGVSRHLIRAADELDSIDGATVDAAVMKVDRQPALEPITPEPTPEPAQPAVAAARPVVRTPLDLVSIPQSPAGPRSTSVLAYSVSTGSPGRVLPGYDEDDEQDQLIDEVVLRVLASFQESATSDDRLELQRARPSIPRDIDRALLLDASDVMEKYDLDEGIRYRSRARFWAKYDQP